MHTMIRCVHCKEDRPVSLFAKCSVTRLLNGETKSIGCKPCNIIRGSASIAKKYGYAPIIVNPEELAMKLTTICAMCEKDVGENIFADHSHIDGRFRGYLCGGCNQQIAIFDKPDLLVKALAYLKLTITPQERTSNAIH